MLAAVTVIVGFCETVQAIPTINGTISFTGGSTINTLSLADATAFTGYSSLSILGGAETGSYSALNGGGSFGGTLSFSPFDFTLNVLTPNPLVPLWTVTFNGITYSFDATSVTVATQNSMFLNLTGNGVAHITGFQDALDGTWSITDVGGSPIFTFGNSTTVPDGGTTVILFGVALTGLGLFRKKLMA